MACSRETVNHNFRVRRKAFFTIRTGCAARNRKRIFTMFALTLPFNMPYHRKYHHRSFKSRVRKFLGLRHKSRRPHHHAGHHEIPRSPEPLPSLPSGTEADRLQRPASALPGNRNTHHHRPRHRSGVGGFFHHLWTSLVRLITGKKAHHHHRRSSRRKHT